MSAKRHQIGIIAVAEGIPLKVIDRFCAYIQQSKPSVGYTVKICMAAKQGVFYKTRYLNEALKELIPICETIIQTDIDLIIPPGLIDEAYKRVNTEKGNCYHHVLRYIKPEVIAGLEYNDFPFDEWLKLERRYNSGCFNCMTSETWQKSGGYHPDMCDWGNEDSWFRKKCQALGIRYTHNVDFPLVHINHPPRTPKNCGHNIGVVKRDDYLSNWL